MHSDGSDLPLRVRPDPGHARNTVTADAEIRACADQHLFQSPYKLNRADLGPPDLGRELSQIAYRIADQLPWPVEGHVAAAVDLEDFHASLRKIFRGGNNVALLRIASQGDHRRMLQQ